MNDMNKKKNILWGIMFLASAYLSLIMFVIIITYYGTQTLAGCIVPLCLTIFFSLFGLFVYHLVKAEVVCKPIRYFLYYIGGIAAIGLPVCWVYALCK